LLAAEFFAMPLFSRCRAHAIFTPFAAAQTGADVFATPLVFAIFITRRR